VAALEDMQAAWGDREAFLCREATKLHEEYRSGRLSTLRESLRARDEVRGEIVLVVAGSGPKADPATDTPEALFAQLVSAGRTRREAVKETARRLRLPARDVYRRVLNDG
jgi:16S rRNA (cytidine1402-2'-O)-methyltransferase